MEKMLRLLLLIPTLGFTLPLPRQDAKNHELSQNLKPLLFLVERSRSQQQQQNDERLEYQQGQQQFGVPSALTFGGFSYFEPQFGRYPGHNQQGFPRVQPSIVVYGAGGQGQPILFNPGIPPGHNFLVPQQPRRPGPDVLQRPIFVGGYPNPKPAHIPPIEKDAEEIPTNPANIPPLPSTSSVDRKPEKLETFNEDTNENPFKTTSENEFPAAPGRTPQLRPGHRFFILNGDDLFQDYPFAYPENLKSAPQYPPNESRYPTQGPAGFNSLPVKATDQISSSKLSSEPSFGPNFYPEQFDPISLRVNQGSGRPAEVALLRSNLPLNVDAADPVGHFRFTPPGEPFYPFEGDDIENESVVVDAKYQEDIGQGVPSPGNQGSAVPHTEFNVKSAEPSTAQAAPGAIALAGHGGVAGASPKATSLAGKGGLAISSPQATAVAGADDEKVEEKNKKPAKKTRNK